MHVIYEDDNIIVVHKEAGEATQTQRGSAPDLVSKLKKHIADETGIKKDAYIGVVHRLDQPVEGLLVFARDKDSAGILSRQVQNDLMNKIYIATVEGFLPKGSKGVLIDRMYKDVRESRAVIVNQDTENCKKGSYSENGNLKKAELSYEVLKSDTNMGTSVLKIHLKTGRFHQIRSQLSNMGHPIVGDVRYGADRTNSKGIGLIAKELDFIHPKTKEKMHFEL